MVTLEGWEFRNQVEDISDGIEHYEELYGSLGRYAIEGFRSIPIETIERYDDTTSWTDIESDSLVGLSDNKIMEELIRFRGREWAECAMRWKREGIPAIVIIDGESNCIADGRGRFNLAKGLGLKSLPVILITKY